MFNEDFVLMLEIISGLDKKDDKIKTLESKLRIIVERNNLDEDYQKHSEDINKRFKELLPKEDK